MKKKISKTEVPQEKEPIESGLYSFTMNEDELFSVIQILSFSKEIYNQMALDMIKVGNADAGDIYTARAQLSAILHNKFNLLKEIGEPSSRHVH